MTPFLKRNTDLIQLPRGLVTWQLRYGICVALQLRTLMVFPTRCIYKRTHPPGMNYNTFSHFSLLRAQFTIRVLAGNIARIAHWKPLQKHHAIRHLRVHETTLSKTSVLAAFNLISGDEVDYSSAVRKDIWLWKGLSGLKSFS